MGWVNYIVVPSRNLAFEISRHIDELKDESEKTLDSVVDQEEQELLDIDRIKLKGGDKSVEMRLNLNQLNELINSHKIVEKLGMMSADHLLMYWFRKSDIKYEVMSEFEFKKKGYDKKGFYIINREE